ncbi:MAG: Rpn family recombination-promoting nuclease/putative transposase, partial [Chloroflexota bacterium]
MPPMDEISQAHDAFFKEMFNQLEPTRDFLANYLPPEITGLLNMDTLEICKDSFVDAALQAHYSDLLYQVNLQSTHTPMWIYVLFEHKSAPEPQVALQLLRYMVRIWEQAGKQNLPLMPILPLVVYHGRSRWTVGHQFQTLFEELPKAMRTHVPDYTYHLCDLTQMKEKDIIGGIQIQVALMAMKSIFQPDMGVNLRKIIDLLTELQDKHTAMECLEAVLRYIVAAADIREEEVITILERSEFGKEVSMGTLAEKWMEQGKQQGMIQGMQQGMQ